MSNFQINFRGLCLVVALLLAIGGQRASAVIIGIDNSESTPTNWNSTLDGLTSDLIDETGAVTAVDVTVSQADFPAGGTMNAGTVPIHVPSLGNLASFDTSVSSVVFSSLAPSTPYQVWVLANYDILFGATSNTVTITGSGAPTVLPFNYVTANNLLINGVTGSSAQLLEDYAVVVTSSATGTIDISISGDGETPLSGVAIQQVVPEPASYALLVLGGYMIAGRRRV